MVSRIVGIGGKYASGKDAIADHLVAQHGWVKLGMSDALSEALLVLNPWIVFPHDATHDAIVAPARYQELYAAVGYVEAKKNPEVRRLLQVLGTEVGRKIIADSVWTDIVSRRVVEASKTAPGVIITGIRFDNEIEMVSETLGGSLWWVDRPLLVSTANVRHSSENSVSADDFDLVVLNDSTLEDLYAKVDSLLP